MRKHVTLPGLFVVLLLMIASIGVRVRDHLRRDNRPTSLLPQPAAVPVATEVVRASPPPVPTVPEALLPVLRAAASPAHPQAPALDESAVMQQLRGMRQSDPELSLRMARQGNEQFPASPDAAERASIVVKSLMRMGRAEEATAEARTLVEEYPESPWALDVRRHMLDIPSFDPDGVGR